MTINKDLMTVHPLAKNSHGGTELLAERLYHDLPEDLLSKFQIFFSRVYDPLDPKRVRIFYAHDLPNDPASSVLANDGWKNFHKLVFVSNWQMQQYIEYFKIPYNHCVVILNSIMPIEAHNKPSDGVVRLGYWSNPIKGLQLLYPVFDKLCTKYDNIELDVFSSFQLYGWDEKDKQLKEFYTQLQQHPKINYVPYLSNDQLRERLKQIHILAYPTIWKETSCLVLMEAMSAGILAVHPNLGAMFETAANWTFMYQYSDDINQHANIFYNILENAIGNIQNDDVQQSLISQKLYADYFYNWNIRKQQWQQLLENMKDLPTELPKVSKMFSYEVK